MALTNEAHAMGDAGTGEAVNAAMVELGKATRRAARALAMAGVDAKDAALRAAAARLRSRADDILAANAGDLIDGRAHGLSPALIDRLALDPPRIEAMAKGLEAIAALPDPVGRVLARFERPNGLHIERVATPLGVIAVIYESRPNVTADAGGLCLKAGNGAILRGGSESFRSCQAIHTCLVEGLEAAGLPSQAIAYVPSRDRAAVGAILTGLNGTIDVIVPRGGKGLVGRVQAEARVPVFAHLEGVNHVYVHSAAELGMAQSILINSKLRRTSVCGAAETLLVDRDCAATHLGPLVRALLAHDCVVRGDLATQAIDPRVVAATPADWTTEYLDSIMAVRVVDGLSAAIDHIATYGSHHTDCIVTADQAAAARFLREVDSAIVLHNASTQFADGGEFGFGAEIGIATGRLHARGPVGVDQLTSFNYRVSGSGQIRP
jgi:glutamate-5-semialdehyde dehydrogenase